MIALFLAGGSGTRLWPLSTKRRPKQFHRLTGSQSMIRETVERVLPFVPIGNVLIVTGRDYVRDIATELPELSAAQIIGEPFPVGTNLAIGLGLIRILERDPDAVVLIGWSDAHIGKSRVFSDVVRSAAAALDRFDGVLIGAEPTSASTAYGYIESVNGAGDGDLTHQVGPILSFHEKPRREIAESYLQRGGFAWNTGISVWRASRLLDLIRMLTPAHYVALDRIRGALGTDREDRVTAHTLEGLERTAIDQSIFEKAANLGTVTADFGWSDVGSWEAIYDISADRDNSLLRGNVVALKTRDCLLESSHKLLAVYGVEDLVVVETDQVVLVTRKSLSANLKEIYEEVRTATGDRFV